MVKKTLDPVFDWDFTFGFEDYEVCFGEKLLLEAWDADFGIGQNDPLGHGELALASHRAALLAGERVEVAVPLTYAPEQGLASTLRFQSAKAVPAGSVHVALTWEAGNLLPTSKPNHQLLPKQRKRPLGSEPSTAGEVRVFLSHATDLRAADRDGFSDPYVKVTLASMVERSAVKEKTLNPTFLWNFTFRFASLDEAARERLVLEAFDHDPDSRNDHLGTASLHLGDLKSAMAKGEPTYRVLDLRYDDPSPAAHSYSSGAPGVVSLGVGAGRLRVHVERAAGLLAGDSDGLSDPYVKLRLGGHTQVTRVVTHTLAPTFDWIAHFGGVGSIEELLAPGSGFQLLEVEVWDYDRAPALFGSLADDPLGKGLIHLDIHAAALMAGQEVQCAVSLRHARPLLGGVVDAGQVFLRISWDVTHRPSVPAKIHLSVSWAADEPIVHAPASDDVMEPLVPHQPPPPKPAPTKTIAMAFGLPLALGMLAYYAEYSPGAVLTSSAFPFVCIIAYLITPIAPADDDPSEPPLPTLQSCLPAPALALYNLAVGVVGAGKEAVFNGLANCMGPLIAPHVLVVAQSLQVSIGIFAVLEALVSFRTINTLAKAIITLGAYWPGPQAPPSTVP